MPSSPYRSASRWRFSIRTTLLVMSLVAVVFGLISNLYKTKRQAEQRLRDMQRHIAYLQQKREFDLDQLETKLEAELQENYRPGRILYGAQLNGAQLRGISIRNDENSFQRAQFCNCDLTDATLTGGGASFQSSRFEEANLTRAKLTGQGASFQASSFANANLTDALLAAGGSSFQAASFVNADLTGAKLQGGGSAFQGSSFDRAKAHNVQILVTDLTSFAAVSINKTEFQGADLSSIATQALESCYFDEPPLYNEKTKFPPGFDPVTAGWQQEE